MKPSTLLALGLTATLGVAGFITSSLQAGPARPAPYRATVVRPTERLQLTPAQRAQIRAVLVAEKETLIGLVSDLREARKGLRAAIRSDQATEDSIRLASALVADVEADLAVERSKLFHQIRPILTQAQKDQIAEAEAKMDDFLADVIGRIGDRLAE